MGADMACPGLPKSGSFPSLTNRFHRLTVAFNSEAFTFIRAARSSSVCAAVIHPFSISLLLS